MERESALVFLNSSIFVVSMILKFPQIFTVIAAKNARGVSVRSLLLELIGFLVFLTYQTYYEYPPVTYLEYPILIAQDAILLMFVLFFNGNIGTALPYAILLIIGWRLLTVHKVIIDVAMNMSTFISASSKYAQLKSLRETRDSGQVSALTWGFAVYTSAARICTTMMTTEDPAVVTRFVVICALNLWVLIYILYYRKGKEEKKDQKEQQSKKQHPKAE
ncbi:solute carrier family 66 member 3 isoform X1 [Callorhinchus milii]|uniref:Solute carrier family 66 member 3 n=1 Tax=Callorhinchus milii TaxID=7868 RepID=V9LES7_CALMI|nr:solute carrier family 66 member 3 isoform X1 [Callorhinchus milii]|eukprot:gi/632958848/ref/XP_007895274.1/ PREDICTED: PQ-loop repeat-containing protein 3 [Callorhinchus milii]